LKKSFKKNQIIITVLAIMIAVAGYINYSGNLRDIINTSTGNDATAEDIVSNDAEPDTNSLVEPGTAVLTSTTVSGIISAAKLNRETVRSQNKETLLEIVNNVNIAADVKKNAVNQITVLADSSEKEMAAELLLEAKGFTDSVVSIVDGKVDVVIGRAELSDTDRVQIEDIVKRKTNLTADKITINICNNWKNLL